MKNLLTSLFNLLPSETVFAHCDIPCGIYDPHQAQLAAHTIIRMMNLVGEVHEEDPKMLAHQISRITKVKEEHAESVKHEVTVLWGDYFKEEHLKDYPKLHELVFKTLKLASKARQGLDLEVAKELLANVQTISEIFYKTKGLEPVRVKSPYPTEGELVIFK
jgi:nickel superoxide dismutase